MKQVAVVAAALSLLACDNADRDLRSAPQPRPIAVTAASDSNAVVSATDANAVMPATEDNTGLLATDAGIDSVPDSVAAAALGMSEAWISMLKKKDPQPAPGESWDNYLPAALREHKMPNSTYKEFQRARPDLAGTAGFGEGQVEIKETPGPSEQSGGQIWFGKVFYEGKGTAGVGGVGYFDPARGTYTLLDLPEARGWSVSTIKVFYQSFFVGLTKYGEAPCKTCDELLHHDLATGKTLIYPIGDKILRMETFNDALWLWTTHGVSILERGKLTRFVVKSDSAGKLGLVRVTPAPPGPPLTTVYEHPVDATYLLSIATGQRTDPQMTQVRIRLIERANPQHVWDLATFSESSISLWWKVLRADSGSVVFSRDGDYGPDHRVKVFFDSRSKKILKRVEYSAHIGIDSVSPAAVSAALAIPPTFVQELTKASPRPRPGADGDSLLPPEVRGRPMPSSTYDEFARARPKRVEDGYSRKDTGIGEEFGPYQRVGSRIWFGKTFYDGEGVTGVGGFGYFDIPTSTYKFLPIKEIAEWSVSAILVEDRYAWIGLVGHPEGADYSGGLLQYDLQTGRVKSYPVEEVVLRIMRQGSKVYLATQSGISIIEQDRLVARFVVEPDSEGGYALIRS
jgi:hypothetical protein